MKVSQTNLFSYEALTSRSLKVCREHWQSGLPWQQKPTTNDSNFVGDHTAGVHPFPSRTRKLSPAGPIVLHAKVCGRVGHRRHKIKADHGNLVGLFLLGDPSLRSGFRQNGLRLAKAWPAHAF